MADDRRVEQLERRVNLLEALLLRWAGADASGSLPVLGSEDGQARHRAMLRAYGYRSVGGFPPALDDEDERARQRAALDAYGYRRVGNGSPGSI